MYLLRKPNSKRCNTVAVCKSIFFADSAAIMWVNRPMSIFSFEHSKHAMMADFVFYGASIVTLLLFLYLHYTAIGGKNQESHGQSLIVRED